MGSRKVLGTKSKKGLIELIREKAFDVTMDPVIICGPDTRIFDANQAACRFFGYDYQEICHLHQEDLFTFEYSSHPPFPDPINRINTAVTGCIQKDGTIRDCRLKWSVFSVNGSRFLYVSISRLWEAEEFERILLERDLVFRKITAAAKDAVIMMDDNGRITFWNQAASEMFGYSEDECIGMNLHELLSPPSYYHSFEKRFDRFRQSGTGPYVGKLLEITALRKNGELFPIELSMASVKIKNRWHAIGIVRDITQRKQAERELRAAKQNLELIKQNLEKALKEAERSALEAAWANAAKSEFLANISHEIRTPLNGIIGVADLLKSQNLSDEQREFIAALETSAQTLMNLIDDILNFSKINAGKMMLEQVPFDLYQIVDEIMSIFTYKAKKKHLDFKCEIDPHIPGDLIGDPGKLRQILINIIGNAIKFTEKGSVHIFVKIQSRKNTLFLIDFYVKDTGIGIPKNQLNRIFEAFTQVDSSTTRKFGGTGLGLAISKKLIELMGGSIDVESSPRGSVFHFELPFESFSEDDAS